MVFLYEKIGVTIAASLAVQFCQKKFFAWNKISVDFCGILKFKYLCILLSYLCYLLSYMYNLILSCNP